MPPKNFQGLFVSLSLIVSDLAKTLRRYPALCYFGWDDIRQQYRRTFLGPLWLTFGTCAWIFGMAVVLAALFNSPVSEFLPHTTIGMFVWVFLALSLTDGCGIFINASTLITSMPLPLFFHVLRALLRYILIYAHYIVVCLLLMIALGHPPGWLALLAVPGMLLHVVAAFGIVLVVGLTNARYRDLLPIVTVLCQLMPMMTPIAWKRDMLQKYTWIADFNPFYHLIEIVRAPLMGHVPSLLSYQVSVGSMLLALGFGLFLYSRVRYRLIFWV